MFGHCVRSHYHILTKLFKMWLDNVQWLTVIFSKVTMNTMIKKKTWDEYLQALKTTCQHLKPLSLKESKRSN